MAMRERELIHGGVSLSDMVLGFFEGGEGNERGSDPFEGDGECSDEEGRENKVFWKTQHQLLQVSPIIHASSL